jgi:NADH-quinone oxidoreductase subunit N
MLRRLSASWHTLNLPCLCFAGHGHLLSSGLVDHGYWGVLSCAVLAMYNTEGTDTSTLTISTASKAVAGVLAFAILILGVYPKPLQQVLMPAAAAVVAK